MKKILSYSVFILSIVLFNSCENEPLTGFDLEELALGQNNNSETSLIKFEYNNTSFVSDQTSAFISDANIGIFGFKNNGEAIVFNIMPNGVSNYELGLQFSQGISNLVDFSLDGCFYGSEPDFDNNTATGELIITEQDEVNQTFSGTFSYIGYCVNQSPVQSLEIINGEIINVPYTVQ